MLNIVFCGGTGANIGKQISDLDISCCFVDTSKSNLKGVKDDLIFVTPETDGGGKDRSLVYEKFKPHVEDILIRFKPSEQLNVVVSSLSGGTGSVVAPMIAKELISAGYNTIVIAIDSKHSVKEMDNTIKTLKTYQSFSDATKKAISMFYIENTSRKEADQRAIWFINLLSLLVNKNKTTEFDTKDLSNFINFNKVTDNRPTVSVIEISGNDAITPEKNTSIVSTILVTKSTDSIIQPATPEYLATCIVTDDHYRNEDLRMDNILGKLSLIVAELDKTIQEHKDNKRINKFNDLEVDTDNEDGIVL